MFEYRVLAISLLCSKKEAVGIFAFFLVLAQPFLFRSHVFVVRLSIWFRFLLLVNLVQIFAFETAFGQQLLGRFHFFSIRYAALRQSEV